MFFRIVPLAFVASQLASCSFVENMLFGKAELDPCDPSYNYYDEDGQHYIRDELVRDDGTIDYQRILEGLDPSQSLCDPLNEDR